MLVPSEEDDSVISITGVGGLGPVGVGGAAHLIGDLDGDLLAHGPGDLAGVLDGNLVTLLLHMLLALGAGGVSVVTSLGISLSLSLAVSVTMSDHMGVMTNNSGAVVNLLVGLMALLGDDVLALLDVGGVHNGVVLLVALLPLLLDGLLVALLLHVLVTLGTRGVASIACLSLGLGLGHRGGEDGTSQEESGDHFVHHLVSRISSHQLCRGGAEAD